jgi:LmbE family N-acetylglucosaminyl deacetylase
MSANSFSGSPTSFPHDARVAIVVAHPDDETLWAGGFILQHPAWDWTIVALCRRSDSDRAPRFAQALARYGARGGMRDMDDGPDQAPLDAAEVEREVLGALPPARYDLVLTHGPRGEYTRHLRHEEVSSAISRLWKDGRIAAAELWMFAYDDAGRRQLPRAIEHADFTVELPSDVWKEKFRIVTELYGFAPDSWEAEATPRVEAFWRFSSAKDIDRWLARKEPQA